MLKGIKVQRFKVSQNFNVSTSYNEKVQSVRNTVAKIENKCIFAA
jgi:hypothetical protein